VSDRVCTLCIDVNALVCAGLRSGVSDYLAANELEAIRKAREVMHHLHYQKRAALPVAHYVKAAVSEPVYDPGIDCNPLVCGKLILQYC
jgi:hypothetical protein